jgi:hypothetical protein
LVNAEFSFFSSQARVVRSEVGGLDEMCSKGSPLRAVQRLREFAVNPALRAVLSGVVVLLAVGGAVVTGPAHAASAAGLEVSAVEPEPEMSAVEPEPEPEVSAAEPEASATGPRDWEVWTSNGSGEINFVHHGDEFWSFDKARDGFGVTALYKWCETCPAYVALHNDKGFGGYAQVFKNFPEDDVIYLRACLSNGGKAPFTKCSSWKKAHT